jgi:hypothetical protein
VLAAGTFIEMGSKARGQVKYTSRSNFADAVRNIALISIKFVLVAKRAPILPPAQDDGLGVVILNSNAEMHFSFTNALGLVSVEQTRRHEAG